MTDFTGQSFGRYHLLEQLGQGGMAVVYKAYDTRLESDAAVKVIRTERISGEHSGKTLKRFEREAKALAKLTHTNIVKVIDYGEHQGQPYLVMPYLPGQTLKHLLTGKPMPYPEVARLLLPIAQALGYSHSLGIIHRDVKPSNILLTASGQPMLSDFGIARMLEEDATFDLTGGTALVGTPEYMAPEQVTSKSPDHRADIYALGIILYEMVTGRKPFTADTPMAVLFKHASDPLPAPGRLVPGLPGLVEKVLIKALAKNPQDRYQTMQEFAQALEGLLGQGAQPAQPQGLKVGWVIGLAGLLLVAAMAGYAVLPGLVPESPTPPPAASQTGVPSPTITLTPIRSTATPQPALGLPSTAIVLTPDEAVRLYDDFSDRAYDGRVNPALWTVEGSNCNIFQQDGLLIFGLIPSSNHIGCDLYANAPREVRGRDLGIFQVSVLMDDTYNRQGIGTTEIFYVSHTMPKGVYWFACGIISEDGGPLQGFMSVDYVGAEIGYLNKKVTLPTQFGAWHTLVLRVEPETFRVTCSVDGTILGSIIPPEADQLRDVTFSSVVEAARVVGAQGPSFIDNVYFGP